MSGQDQCHRSLGRLACVGRWAGLH